MGLSEGKPFKTGANPHTRDQNINRANVCENKMVQTHRDLNCSGASPKKGPHPGLNPLVC